MNKLTLIISSIILIPTALVVVVISFLHPLTDLTGDDVRGACTMEAKLCPDGSYVGRSGPKCEFTACPSGTTSPSPVPVPPITQPTPPVASSVASLNQSIISDGVIITPLEVKEDSRCPVDVQCVWAGRVSVRVKYEKNGKSKEVVMEEGGSVQLDETQSFDLVDVSPDHNSKKPFSAKDYRFTFKTFYSR